MKHNIKYLFKNKIAVFVSLSALLFVSCANDLSKTDTDTAVTGIHVNSVGDSLSVVKGDTYRLQAKVLPENASDKRLFFLSNAEETASINAVGLITAHETGAAEITIRAANGVQKTINVTVTAATIHVTSIEFEEEPANPVELIIGESYELKLKVMPDDAANKELRITSSDGRIAWPNGDGNRSIKADGAVGDATVTITSVDNPSVKKEVHFKTKQQPAGSSISIETLSVLYESNEDDVTFKVKTINGKLNYTPEVVGGGKEWANFVSKDGTNPAEDTVRLHLKKNKTVWVRTAYIKFKDNNTNNYVKAAGKDLQVKIIQKKNEHPAVTIKWVHGITGPGGTEKQSVQIVGSNPGDYHNTDYVFTWNETSTTKFFNARKVDYTNPPNKGRRDSKQCWAKTDSNMLHWWFVQNENNINQYITKKNITKENNAEMYKMYKPVYKRGIANDQEPQKSTIANLFRAKCINHGGDPARGLQWYLFGLKNFENADDKSYSPALFPDVFSESNTPIKKKRIYTKKEFEDMLKEALESKKAIGINLDKSSGEAHAITLWGAAFDEDNNVIAIYVVDNNDGVNNMIFPYGIRYKDEVDIYTEADIHNPYYDQHHFKPYLFNFSANAKMDYYIGEMTTLDKAEVQWQDWLSKH